jgi:hypothetical protein
VTCTGEVDSDGTAFTFEGEIFRGVPGYVTCVIAGESSDQEYTVLPLACAAEGMSYTTAIRLQLKKDALMIEWARERSSNAEAYEFMGEAIVLSKCLESLGGVLVRFRHFARGSHQVRTHLSKRHRDTPMAGRTHLQQALPVTFATAFSV